MRQKPFRKVAVSHLKKLFVFGLALSLSFWPQQPAEADTASFVSSGTFTVPDGVTSIVVELWGGGGAGGAGGGTKYGGGGGAGGQYAKKTLSVTPGANYVVTVGTGGATTAGNGNPGGDTKFGATLVIAKGGAGGYSYANRLSGAAIGTTAGGVGDTVYAGGSGAAGATTYSGGGGGGAGTSGAGSAASTYTAGTGRTNYGGNGGAGTASSNTIGGNGSTYSGGGGGATKTSTSAGAGANGFASITYTSPVTYKIQYYTDGNGSLSGGAATQIIPEGGDGTEVCAVANSGYRFDRWDDGVTTECRTETKVSSNLQFTANFATNNFTLLYSAGAGGTLSGDAIQYVALGGSGSAVTAVPDTGYHFVQWSDGSTSNPRTDKEVTGNISVTAVFGVDTFTLTYSSGSGGYLSGTSPQTVNYGANGTAVQAIANTGYHFVNWSDGLTANPRTDTNVTGNKTVTANFTINTFTLTYTANANGSITGTSPQTVNYGANGTAVTAVPAANYYFVQWSDGSTANPRTDTNITANKAVSATFALNNYTLTYTAGANGSLTGTSPQTVAHGSNGTAVTPVPNTGYHFVNWSDGSTANPRTDTNVTGNKSVTANFAINTYTLTYTAGSNGTITGTSPQTVNYGANGTAVTPVANTGYHFVNWSDGSTANPRTDTNITANKSVTANFAINTYTLTYTAGSNGSVTGTSPQTVNHGANGTAVTAVPNTNYNFSQWSDGVTSNPRTDTNVTGNKAVTAQFTAVASYTLTYTAGSNGTITGTSPQTVFAGGNGTAVTAVANTGYHFVNWSDSSTANPRTDTNVNANKSVTANFTINTYTLLYSAGAGGSLSGTATQYVAHGGDGTAVTAVASTGYHFTQWSDGSTTNPRTEKGVTADKSVTANFAINTYTLSYTAGTGGTITGTATQTVNHGANGTAVTAVPNASYNFSQWSDGSTANPRTDTNVTGNKSVTAQFTAVAPNYTLTYTAGANGSITGTSPQTVVSGGNGTAVTAVPNANYHFVNWSDGSTANPRTDTNVTTNKSVTANFAINTFTLAYTAGANGTITGTSPQTVNYGANGTAVTAAPSTGYHFVNWSDSSTANPRTDTNVTANKSVTANFAINTYTLTYTAGTNGTITGTSPQTVNHGANGTAVTAVPSTGYHFTQWSDGSTANPRTDTNVTGNKSVTATFTINTYTLLYSAGAGGSLTGTATQYVTHGGDGTDVTAVASTGYHFTQWSDGSTTNPRTEKGVTADKSVTASFAINTYTLTYTAGTGGTITGTSPQTVNHGANGTAVTAIPNANYNFSQWSDGSTANPRTDTNITANKSVTAQFSAVAPNYTLTYTAGSGGSISGTSPQTIVSGGNGTAVSAVANTGYHFVNWSDASTANPRTDTNVTANKSVTANFAINTYTLTYIATNGTISGTNPQTVNHGGSGTAVTAVPYDNYHFLQWSDGSTANPRTDTNVIVNKTVAAQFGINELQLVYKAGTGGTVTGELEQVVIYGKSGTPVTAVPNAGYNFSQWSDGLTQNPRTDQDVTDNITVTAEFSAISPNYTLTYAAGANGSILGTSPQTVLSGGDGEAVEAVPNTGYHFTQWSDASTANPRKDTNVVANKSVTASFALNTYTLMYNPGVGGYLSGTAIQYVAHGGNGTAVTANPNTGYTFVKWSDGVTANPRTDLAVTGDLSVTAVFNTANYTLTYTANANGSITGTSPQSVPYGGSGSAVTAVANTGYHFTQWSDGSLANPRIDKNVTANKSVSASFAINTYTLAYVVEANGTLTGTATQTVNHGANGTAVTAVPSTGYHFEQWSDGSTANPRTDTNVTSDNTYSASFAINTFTLTYAAGTGGTLSGSVSQTISYGANGSAVTAVPNANYNFSQWSDGSTQNPRIDTNITANKSVTAQFTAAAANYTLTYLAGANGNITGLSPQTVAAGGNGSAVTAVPDTHYHFVNWSDSGTANPRTDTNVAANKTLTASFAIDTYTLMYSAAAGGYLSGTAIQYIGYGSYGTAVTAMPNAGYHFTQWSDGSTQNPRMESNVTADKSITASFAVNTYTVSYSALNGSITGSSTQVISHGSNATAVTATANSGYEFVQWSDGLQTLSRTDTNITSARSYEAQFAMAGVTTNSISGGTNKVMVGSFKGGLVADIPLKLKYTAYTAVAGSEIFNDRTPYSNNATNHGAVASADSLAFDGVNDYAFVPVTPSLQTQTNLTMSAWVKPNAAYTGDMIMVGDNGYYLTVSGDWSLQTYWWDKSSQGYHSSGAGTITPGAWNFVTAVWSASDVRLYVNGVLKNTVASTGAGRITGNLYIGARDAAGSRAFKGSIANVKIHNKALSGNEVEELYGQGLEESAFMVGGN